MDQVDPFQFQSSHEFFSVITNRTNEYVKPTKKTLENIKKNGLKNFTCPHNKEDTWDNPGTFRETTVYSGHIGASEWTIHHLHHNSNKFVPNFLYDMGSNSNYPAKSNSKLFILHFQHLMSFVILY